MPKIVTHSPILRAFVARIRANASIKAALVGGIHEGFAAEKDPYPFFNYSLVAAPYDRNWGDATLITLIDGFVFSTDPVQARDLDAAIADWLEDAPLAVDGQRTLLCQREAGVPMPPDVDNEGHKVYQVGGTYRIETDFRPS
jgi:hypothetical protein